MTETLEGKYFKQVEIKTSLNLSITVYQNVSKPSD